MKKDPQEGEDHGEQHPHIDQLDIVSLRQRVSDPGKAENVFSSGDSSSKYLLKCPYKVVKTSRTVRLTSTTMSI